MRIYHTFLKALLVFCACLAVFAHAQTVIDVGNGKSIEVAISRNDLNRIGLFGGKLMDLKFKDGELDAQPEARTGAYFLLPKVNSKISVFLTSLNGQVHHLILRPEDVQAQSYVLREPKLDDPKPVASTRSPTAPEARPSPQTAQVLGRAHSIDAAVKRIMGAMARNERPSDMRHTEHGQELMLWQGSRFWWMSSMVGTNYTGDHFRIQNTSPEMVRVDEREFYKRGVIAVSLELHQLAPGETTDVYIVKETSNDQK